MTSVPHYDHRFHAIVVGKIPSFLLLLRSAHNKTPATQSTRRLCPQKKVAKLWAFLIGIWLVFDQSWRFPSFEFFHCFVFFASVLVCLQFVAIVVLVASRRSLEDWVLGSSECFLFLFLFFWVEKKWQARVATRWERWCVARLGIQRRRCQRVRRFM